MYINFMSLHFLIYIGIDIIYVEFLCNFKIQMIKECSIYAYGQVTLSTLVKVMIRSIRHKIQQLTSKGL